MKPLDRQQFSLLITEALVKPRLKKELRFVPEEITAWEERDFLAVFNKSRTEGVLIVPFAHRVVSFELRPLTPKSNGALPAAVICDFCVTWQRSAYVAAITFRKDRHSITYLVCEDLECSRHVRGRTAASQLSRTQLREDISDEGRIERLRQRVAAALESL